MQLFIEHDLPKELVLPINYHRVIQGIIYNGMNGFPGYGDFLHTEGYAYNERQYRLFTFSLLKGKYRIEQGNIIFREHVSFEVRSPEALLLKILKEKLESDGIQYQTQRYNNVQAVLMDETVEWEKLYIRMKTPLVGYKTDKSNGKTYFYSPDEQGFYDSVYGNFLRKYCAYTGISVAESIELQPLRVSEKDKYVTKYKGFYITGWFGEYALFGPRKYLDFLYQTGLGSKNAQGFGMFEVVGVIETDEGEDFY